MGLSFFAKPLPGERVEAHISLPQPAHALLCGRVTDDDGQPVIHVPVLLLRDGEDFPAAQCLSDEHGLFCFGPLEGDQLYQLRVFPGGPRIRRLDVQL